MIYPALKKLDPNHQERWFHPIFTQISPDTFSSSRQRQGKILVRVKINTEKFWIIQAIIILMIYLTKIPLHQVQWCERPENREPRHEPLPEPQHVIHSKTRQEIQDTHLNYHAILPGNCSNRIILIHFWNRKMVIFDPFIFWKFQQSA